MRRLAALAVLLAAAPAFAQVAIDVSVGPVLSQAESFEALWVQGGDFGGIIIGREDVGPSDGSGFDVAVRALAGTDGFGVHLGLGYLQTTQRFDAAPFADPSQPVSQTVTARRGRVSLGGQFGIESGSAQTYLLADVQAQNTLGLSGEGDLFGPIVSDEPARGWTLAAGAGAGAVFRVGGVWVGPEVRYTHDISGVKTGFGRFERADGTRVQFLSPVRVHAVTAALVVRLGGPRRRAR